MERDKKLRRIGILCIHFARNYAYYRAKYDDAVLVKNNQFWLTVTGNFLDISVLKWSKLFGNHKEKHHWKKAMSDNRDFQRRMLESVEITEDEFKQIHSSIQNYRNKFIAHLDNEDMMSIPYLDKAMKLVCFYYTEALIECKLTADWKPSLEEYYDQCYSEAVQCYAAT